MVRQHTHLAQRASPRTQRPVRQDIRPAQAHRSPLAARYALAKDPRARLRATNTSRFLKIRSQLATIREEEEECGYGSPRHAQERDLRRELDAAGLTSDEDEMDWDDEKTLVAMLQEKVPDEDTDSELIALAERLKGPMTAQAQCEMKYLTDTYVPVIRRVSEVHKALDEKVDLEFATGLLAFDEVCKKTEAMAIRDEDELKTAYLGSQNNTTRLMDQLAEAYARRDQLWTKLEEDVAQCAGCANAALDALPADLEQIITRLEKKSKELDKDTGAMSKQKILKGLLDKL
ncbi:hypothetical protein OBBRIDRAFT_780568 [Obba rivulosa]|uniref:Uncharacterized protein n=1 Tax=Obba rivulosa TaxID=1052685 RepID=A0A8E2ANY4_9APHY|nr:hypothetical protein OBBRIDRAFT_780568 [Obba rivulosa]